MRAPRAILVAGVVVIAIGATAFICSRPRPDASTGRSDAKVQPSAATVGKTRFQSARYGYSFLVSGSGSVVETSPAQGNLEVLAVGIDRDFDPMYVCATSNDSAWSPHDLFNHWKD